MESAGKLLGKGLDVPSLNKTQNGVPKGGVLEGISPKDFPGITFTCLTIGVDPSASNVFGNHHGNVAERNDRKGREHVILLSRPWPVRPG